MIVRWLLQKLPEHQRKAICEGLSIPWSPSKIIPNLLLPEAVSRLILEDLQHLNIGRSEAVQITIESTDYGMVLFPSTADMEELSEAPEPVDLNKEFRAADFPAL